MKNKIIAITVLLILAIVVISIFQKNKTTNFEDIVSTNAESIAEIEVTKDVFDGNKERVSFMKKEETAAFFNEFSGLKLKENKDMGTYSIQFDVQIKLDNLYLDYF